MERSLPDTEGLEPLVPEAADAVRCLADQEIDQVLRSEAFARAGDGGEQLLGLDRAVEGHDAVDAQVAVAARLRLLPEIGQQGLAPAPRCLAERDEGVQALPLDPLLLLAGFALLDLHPAKAHVVETIEGQRVGRRTVAPGAADLLVIGLDGFRQRRVGDEAHVGLVDAHPEGDGRAHDDPVFLQEPSWFRARSACPMPA